MRRSSHFVPFPLLLCRVCHGRMTSSSEDACQLELGERVSLLPLPHPGRSARFDHHRELHRSPPPLSPTSVSKGPRPWPTYAAASFVCRTLQIAGVAAVVLATSYILGFLGAVALSWTQVINQPGSRQSFSPIASSPLSSTSSGVAATPRRHLPFIASNEYTEDASLDTAKDYGWGIVAEPYR